MYIYKTIKCTIKNYVKLKYVYYNIHIRINIDSHEPVKLKNK